MNSLPIERFAALTAVDIYEQNCINGIDHLENAVISFGAEFVAPMLENKLQIVDPMQRAAVNAVATFATSYAYSYLMNRPVNMSRTAKKAFLSEGLIYAYKRYR